MTGLGVTALVLFVCVFLFFGVLAVIKIFEKSKQPKIQKESKGLSGLPSLYYILAMFCGGTLLLFTVANWDKLDSFQVGSLIGYTVGGVVSMLAVGRVIELLEQIRDAVRS